MAASCDQDGWVDACNRRCSDAGLKGQTLMSVLVNEVEENDTQSALTPWTVARPWR
jgi:hypothetical protein